MARPITLFTGQWADLPFEEVARLAGEWGYDGLEIACWGDHFDPWAAVEDDSYVAGRREILAKYGLEVYAISNHLTGQAVCDDPIDERHKAIVPARVWGDGEPEGVRQRAAEAMKVTARAAAKLGVNTVVGFTGSKIWKTVAALEAVGHREAFGLTWDPSHFVWQDLDPVGFLWDFKDRIYHVDCKDAKRQVGNGRNGRMGSHLAWADPRRGWDFVSTGHGDVSWEACFRMLNTIGYDGPISVEWEDAGMDRLLRAPEALAFVPRLGFYPPAAAFDAAFASGN